eukprot:COSAG02_NODE_20245_length_841_cov_1.268194_2_plen_100_part_00
MMARETCGRLPCTHVMNGALSPRCQLASTVSTPRQLKAGNDTGHKGLMPSVTLVPAIAQVGANLPSVRRNRYREPTLACVTMHRKKLDDQSENSKTSKS